MTGFIGGGNMAEALIKGMVAGGRKEVLVSEPREERRKELEGTYGIETTESNREVVGRCNIVILAVKPQQMGTVLEEISGEVTEERTIVSIAAGITLSYLSGRLGTKKIIRVMPNTPALVQAGMSVMSYSDALAGSEVDIVKTILMSVGRVIVLPEELMDAVTALSGSGPAFIALFTEAMIDAGEKLGLRKADAAELAVQTLWGTAKMLNDGMPAEKLRAMVTSPGGTTAEGLKIFEGDGLREMVGKALQASKSKAEELGRRE